MPDAELIAITLNGPEATLVARALLYFRDNAMTQRTVSRADAIIERIANERRRMAQ